MYINGASAISPLPVFDALEKGINFKPVEGQRAKLAEPDYSLLIEPKLIRRMSRIIRMGVATAMDALKQAKVQQPDAIITGTAFGCLDDTGIFLKRMVENQEEMLTPTAFIQSTHNTVGAQVALLLKCHAYNNTYVQRAQSFELSLQDALLWLTEQEEQAVLVGAADELTEYSYRLLERFGLFRHQSAGEGAAYFLLQQHPGPACWARIRTVRTLFQPTGEELQEALQRVLEAITGPVDLLLTGETNGDPNREGYKKLSESIGSSVPVLRYKVYCGEYPTSTAFATWLAAYWLKKDHIRTESLDIRCPQNVLVYQTDPAGYHSFILLSHVES